MNQGRKAKEKPSKNISAIFFLDVRSSVSPLFSGINQPDQDEEIIGTASLAQEEYADELPEQGLGDDFINEVYRVAEEGSDNERFSSTVNEDSGGSNVANNNIVNNNLDNRNSLHNSNNDFSAGGNSRRPRPSSASNQVDSSSNQSSEDIKDVLSALRGLITLLSSTEQGRKKLNKIRQKLYMTSSKKQTSSADGSKIQVADIILGEPLPARQTLIENQQHFGGSTNQNSIPWATMPLNVGASLFSESAAPAATSGGIFSNSQLPSNAVGNYGHQSWEEYGQAVVKPAEDSDTDGSGATIPPHLIPLGPDGQPLINPNGNFINQPNFQSGHIEKLADLFPYLTTTTTTPQPESDEADLADTDKSKKRKKKKKKKKKKNKSRNKSKSDEDDNDDDASEDDYDYDDDDDKDIMTTMIDSIRDLPMDTKRHMMANMMFFVPMAALSMAAAGVPHLAIAPLATLIPGFLFAAFTETNSDPTRRRPSSHGHHHGRVGSNGTASADGDHGHHGTGLSGLISNLRNFYANRRQNQTLQIFTDPHHHG